jgi:hypothetical protein
MKKYAVRFTTIAMLTAVAALVLGLAAPAGATDMYTPSLTSTVATAPKVAVASAAYTPKIAAKRTARIAKVKAAASATASGTDAARARAILAGLIAKYPILKGTTVEIGDARGHQAIAFYQSGRIVISRTHTASLERILNHEIWHVIDYRDNGKINWGENVPPSNASSFRG